MTMNEESKDYIKVLEVLGELSKSGIQVKREINAVLALLMNSFGFSKENLDKFSK